MKKRTQLSPVAVEVAMVLLIVLTVTLAAIIAGARNKDHKADLHTRAVTALSLTEPNEDQARDIRLHGLTRDAAIQAAKAAHPGARVIEAFLANVTHGVAQQVWAVIVESSDGAMVMLFDARMGTPNHMSETRL